MLGRYHQSRLTILQCFLYSILQLFGSRSTDPPLTQHQPGKALSGGNSSSLPRDNSLPNSEMSLGARLLQPQDSLVLENLSYN